jgi:hypothetical protein
MYVHCVAISNDANEKSSGTVNGKAFPKTFLIINYKVAYAYLAEQKPEKTGETETWKN